MGLFMDLSRTYMMVNCLVWALETRVLTPKTSRFG